MTSLQKLIKEILKEVKEEYTPLSRITTTYYTDNGQVDFGGSQYHYEVLVPPSFDELKMKHGIDNCINCIYDDVQCYIDELSRKTGFEYEGSIDINFETFEVKIENYKIIKRVKLDEKINYIKDIPRFRGQ